MTKFTDGRQATQSAIDAHENDLRNTKDVFGLVYQGVPEKIITVNLPLNKNDWIHEYLKNPTGDVK